MLLPDIRDSISGQDESALRNALSSSLPGSYGVNSVDMSGMDCFIAVVRHICGLVGHDLINHVATNKALKFVMADYSASTDEQRDQVQKYRVATFKMVQELVGKESPTFEDIVECNQVRQKFWSRDGLRLFLAVMYRDDNTSPWNSAFDHTFEAAKSLVDWRLNDYGTIEEVLTETKFGVKSLSNGGEALSLFGSPRIIRIRLSSRINRATWKGGSFTIGNARCFSYNDIARKSMRTRADGTTIIRDSFCGGVEDKIVYYLIAVVRLRNPGEDRDYARLYDIESRNIPANGDPEHLDTFNNQRWSLSHLDHDHMLYYARADNRPMSCIRHRAEIGDQNSDYKTDPRGERQMEGLWQKRYRGVKRRMDSDQEIGHDDNKRPKLADSAALSRGAAMAPTSLSSADAQGASNNGPLPEETNRAAQGQLGPQRNHATGLEITTPQSQLPAQVYGLPLPRYSLPSDVPSRARSQFLPPLLVSSHTSFLPSPAPAPAPTPTAAPTAGRGGRKGNKKSSGNMKS